MFDAAGILRITRAAQRHSGFYLPVYLIYPLCLSFSSLAFSPFFSRARLPYRAASSYAYSMTCARNNIAALARRTSLMNAALPYLPAFLMPLLRTPTRAHNCNTAASPSAMYSSAGQAFVNVAHSARWLLA